MTGRERSVTASGASNGETVRDCSRWGPYPGAKIFAPSRRKFGCAGELFMPLISGIRGRECIKRLSTVE